MYVHVSEWMGERERKPTLSWWVSDKVASLWPVPLRLHRRSYSSPACRQTEFLFMVTKDRGHRCHAMSQFLVSPHILYERTVSQICNYGTQLRRPHGGQTEKSQEENKKVKKTFCFPVHAFTPSPKWYDEGLTGAWWDSSSRPSPRTDLLIPRLQSHSPKDWGKTKRAQLSGANQKSRLNRVVTHGMHASYSSMVMRVSEGRMRAMVAAVTSPSLLLDMLEESTGKL